MGVFTPFNSLVLEILADSKALVVASTAAMIAFDLEIVQDPTRSFCPRLRVIY